MRCKTCDYSLWNITARKCPECGTDFKPSDFHFVPNSVRFLCPHCEQDYYGTTEQGHLIPRTFHCVKCGQRVDMDEMLLLPTAGVDESRTAADVMPWLQRKQFGWFKAWFKTLGMAMVAPAKLMRAVPRDSGGGSGGLGESAFFCLATNAIITGFGVALPLAVIAFIMMLSRDRGALGMLGGAVATLVGGGVVMLVVATLWALLAHGLLKISGPTDRGVGGTMQSMYYSSAANLPLALPCLGPYCGGYFLWIWWLVSAILMVMEAQKVRGLRATLCVGAGPVIGAALTVAWFTWIVLSAASVSASFGGGTFGGGGGYVAAAEAKTIHAAIMSHAAANNGAAPAHALELVASGRLTAANFAMWQTGHDEANVNLATAGMTLDQYQYLPTNRMNMAAQAASAAQPVNIIAHRVGDVVFTYHGIADLRSADPNLWVAVVSSDPDQAGVAPTPAVGRGSSGIQPLLPIAVDVSGSTYIVVPGALQTQNAIRANSGLPPLPDPATIRNNAPAISP